MASYSSHSTVQMSYLFVKMLTVCRVHLRLTLTADMFQGSLSLPQVVREGQLSGHVIQTRQLLHLQ
jgi:hypothetical protein